MHPWRLLGLLSALAASATALPPQQPAAQAPFAFATEAAFIAELEKGQFDPQMDLHLLEYASDSRWAAHWAASRGVRSGLFGEYGSTAAHLLYTHTNLALNASPHDRIQFRYERRIEDDERFAARDERLSVLWYPRASWALIASGWPTHRKESASVGLGLRIGGRSDPNALEVLLMDDRAFWNQKTDTDLRYIDKPIRLLVDGYGAWGPWTLFGTVSLESTYRAKGGTEGTRSCRGHLRQARMDLGYHQEGWSLGAEVRMAASLYDEHTPEGPGLHLARHYVRLKTHGRLRTGGWTTHGLLAFSRQRDTFASPSVADGDYRARSLLAGLEVARPLGLRHELRLGYLGGQVHLARETSPGAPEILGARRSTSFEDKVHLRWLHAFRPGFSLEALLSHSVAGSRFGGGSVKALIVF